MDKQKVWAPHQDATRPRRPSRGCSPAGRIHQRFHIKYERGCESQVNIRLYKASGSLTVLQGQTEQLRSHVILQLQPLPNLTERSEGKEPIFTTNPALFQDKIYSLMLPLYIHLSSANTNSQTRVPSVSVTVVLLVSARCLLEPVLWLWRNSVLSIPVTRQIFHPQRSPEKRAAHTDAAQAPCRESRSLGKKHLQDR